MWCTSHNQFLIHFNFVSKLGARVSWGKRNGRIIEGMVVSHQSSSISASKKSSSI
jgi:hypothetical protein